ncbi:hypothetical protein HPP92_018068 [Vanilla planifolia]|uniref:Uncharacterized protein n=1 Tax=Vanilla planifolia TaxID=51239 RepID=A0A835Q942_VANPL|nr:hypothetical protein HPP92_018068 [Vanilla planifolia]
MELPVNEGGAGGKMQRRLFRRRGLTPYDRPSSAVRGPRRIGTASETGSGWLSKLVNPASRIIAGGAARLLSSVFSKRLAAPNEDQGYVDRI